MSFSPSGRLLLVSSGDKTASIWKVPSGTAKWSSTPHLTLKGHTEGVLASSFLGDDSHVITGSYDSTIRVWRTSDGKQTAVHQCVGRV